MIGQASLSLTARLWRGIEPTYAAILAHPFVTGLTDGTLDERSFAFYVTQDALYLADYARALAAVGARAPTTGEVAMFCNHAAGAVAVERTLHETLLAELGIDPSSVAGATAAPTNRAYTSYLLAVAHSGSYAEGVAAVLPCYWIYAEVGKALLGAGSPDPRYRRWIETYGGEEFGAIVAEVLACADALGESVSATDEALMHEHFRTTSRYEWMFWDMGYRREAWPV